MMKNALITVSLCLVSTFVLAQPVITALNWGLMQTHTYAISTQNLNPDPTPPGNNVTWDFTNLTPADVSDTFTMNAGGSTAYGAYFPGSNLNYFEYFPKTGLERYQMYSVYSTGIDYMGYVNVGGTIAPWNTDMKVVKFPFTFNTSFTSYYKNYDDVAGYVTTTYDGYGTLKLPDTTFTNVYRLKTYDSVSTSVYEYRYAYFTSVNRLMTMTVKANGSKEIKYFYHKKSGGNTGIVTRLENTFSVYPNPSSGRIQFQLDPGYEQTVTVAVYNACGEVMRVYGKIELDNSIELPFEPGVYFLELRSLKGTCRTKLVLY